MTQPTLFRTLLLGLPIGLILLGTGSLVYHFSNKGKEDAKAPDQAFSFLQKAVNEADLREFTQRLATDIGARDLASPVRLNQTLSYVEGLLGQSNFGYREVKRVPIPSAPGAFEIQAQILGKRRPDEVVLLSASYCTPPLSAGAHSNGSGVAVLLALAQAWVGTQPERTLRLLFTPHPLTAADGPPHAAQALAESWRAAPENLKLHVHLCGLGAGVPSLLPNQAALQFLPNAAAMDQSPNLAKNFSENAALKVAERAEPSPFQFFGEILQGNKVPCVLVTDAISPQQATPSPLLDTPEALNLPVLTEITRGLQRAVEVQLYPSKQLP